MPGRVGPAVGGPFAGVRVTVGAAVVSAGVGAAVCGAFARARLAGDVIIVDRHAPLLCLGDSSAPSTTRLPAHTPIVIVTLRSHVTARSDWPERVAPRAEQPDSPGRTMRPFGINIFFSRTGPGVSRLARQDHAAGLADGVSR